MFTPRTALLLVIFSLVLLAAPSESLAQYVGRSDSPNGPTTSPYLNLLSNNSIFNPVSTYQTLVKPLVDQNSALQRQGSAINRLQQQVNSGPIGGGGGGGRPGATGSGGYFMYYSHFYPRQR